jgi:diacylglycerol O-acyltransferase
MHHCVADGVAALELLLNVLRTDPEPDPVMADTGPWTPDPIPTRAQWLRVILGAWIRGLGALPRLLGRTVCGLLAMFRHIRAHRIEAPVPFRAPVLAFNRSLSANRSFAAVSLSLADMKAIKDRFGVTLNDVVLAVCSGALRRYLGVRNELPEASLTVGVPFNTQPARSGRLGGNRVGNIIATLRTDLGDPEARLRAIHRVMEDGKKRQAALGSDILESWAEFAPPRPYSFVMGLWSRFKLSDRVHPPFNVVVSNVSGSRLPLHIAGARLVAFHSVGPIVEGIGLNITAWSYAGEMHFAALACPEQVPDIWDLVGYLPEALRELTCASGAAVGPSSAPASLGAARPAKPGPSAAPTPVSSSSERARAAVTIR